ncbi:MAG: NADP oxidoreductase [Spirochaetota bacterium]
MAKPKIATTHMTGCFGCHMSILDIDEKIVDLVELVDFDKSPVDDIKKFTGPVDIGIIEGGVSTQENVEVLRMFREHCKILISFGECANTGGVPHLRNTVPLRECVEEAYLNGLSVVDGVIPNDPDIPLLLDKVYPVHQVVKVDYFMPGCPPRAEAIWAALSALLQGEKPQLPYELIKYD